MEHLKIIARDGASLTKHANERATNLTVNIIDEQEYVVLHQIGAGWGFWKPKETLGIGYNGTKRMEQYEWNETKFRVFVSIFRQIQTRIVLILVNQFQANRFIHIVLFDH